MRRLLIAIGAKRRELARDEDGTSLVETTIAMPFLLVIGLGLFEFGNLLYNHHLVSTGVRDAARYAARFADPTSREDEAKRLAVTGRIDLEGAPRVPWWDVGDVDMTVTQIDNSPDPITGERPYRGGAEIRVVRVETTVSYGSAEGLGVLGFLGLGDAITFTLAHEQRGIGE